MTTNYIINLRDYLEKNHAKEWKADLTGVYLAGALHILKKEDEATKLIGAYRIGQVDKKRINDFYPLPNGPGNSSNYFKQYLSTFDRNQYDVKINWNRSPVHQIWAKIGVMDVTVAGI